MNDSYDSDIEWLTKTTCNRTSANATVKSTNSGKPAGREKVQGKRRSSTKEKEKSTSTGKTIGREKVQETRQISIFRPNRISTPVSKEKLQKPITNWFAPDRRASTPKIEEPKKNEKVSRGKRVEAPQRQERTKKVEVPQRQERPKKVEVEQRKRKADPPQPQEKKKIENQPPMMLSLDDSIFNDSFDELKLPEKPKGQVVVRKKSERCKLHGHECLDCKKYYDALNLNPEERAKRINEVSRHRTTYRPMKRAKTPEHFWEIDFPDTEEAFRRGYFKRIY